MKSNILAIDLGTSSCKLAVFDRNLDLLAETSRSYKTVYPFPGGAQQNPEQWWSILKEGIRTLFGEKGMVAATIGAIGIDAMGSALVSVGRQGEVLYPSLLWMDRRAEQEARELEQTQGALLRERNGNRSDPSNIAPKILWLKRNEPEVYAQTRCFLHANGYLVMKLTGNLTMDRTEGGLTQLFDTSQGQWDEALISRCGLDREKFPPVFDCQDVAGSVTAAASGETGLPQGIPVIAGSMDMCAAALGAGVYKSGQVYISAGTVTAVGACLDRPEFHPDMHIYSHAVPGLYIKAAGVDYGGAGLKWFKEVMDLEDFTEIDEKVGCEEDGRSPLLFLPYMVGQRAPLWNSAMTGAIAGLQPETDRTDLYRMFMQGNAFGVRRILSLLIRDGQGIDMVRMTGGCSRSAPWMKIFTDTVNLPFEVPASRDVAVLGCAALAAVGCGIREDYAGIFDERPPQATYLPEEKNARYLGRLYAVYCDFLECMLPVMESLSQLRRRDDDC